MKDYMTEFCNLPTIKKFKIKPPNNDRPYLQINDPYLLVRFAGYLKEENTKKVFFRGQTDYHEGKMIPTLFRDEIDEEKLKNRYDAYNFLLRRVKNNSNRGRFRRKNDGAILQHYGIRTPWLDVLDNLYTAIWFATMKPSKKEPIKYDPIKNGNDGYIFFIRVDPNIIVSLLREEHSSLSLRLHTQQGISVRRKHEPWNQPDLNEFIIGTVKFRKDDSWKLNGYLFDTQFMFPSKSYDSTYKFLKDKFPKYISKAEKKYHLSEGELGKIDDYLDFDR